MESVLKKTVSSLETALRYNPENIELMTSLVEGYIRMGRLDANTMALCEKVLAKYPENVLLIQAQAITYVIEQTDQLDESLTKGQTLPPVEVLESSIHMLEEFLASAGEAANAWFAWTRLCLLAGRYDQARKGVQRLQELNFADLAGLRHTLDWLARKQNAEQVDWPALHQAYCSIDEEKLGIKALERAFDKGVAKEAIGPSLLNHYISSYSAAQLDEVPEAIRPRFFQLLVDFGDANLTGEWLRKASLYGWQVTSHTKAYARSLIEDDQLDSAFEVLQRMTMDEEIKGMLNAIASTLEKEDQIEQAVTVLQFINLHELNEDEIEQHRENEFHCNAERSLADFQYKNGRYSEALKKYTSALCMGREIDHEVLDRIEEMISEGVACDLAGLMQIAVYFRSLGDLPRGMQYLNRMLEREPENQEALEQMEALFDQALLSNPNSPELRLQRGIINKRRGRFEEAMADFNLAAASPDTSEEASRMIARTFRDAQRFPESLAKYQSFSVGQQDLDALYQLHMDFVHADDSRSARTALELIRDVQPNYRDVAERVRIFEGRQTSGHTAAPENDDKMREIIGDLATGRYQYVGKLGSGGMGVVYKVFDVRQNQEVAMKILRDGLASSSKALDRFFREARIAAQIKHRNIVDIYDYNISSQDGQNYIVMEFIDGQSLREFIDLHFDDTISTSMDYLTEMLYYGVQLFDALLATHTRGIIHRDIKPDNIMINLSGTVKITDFGIVHVEEATFTPTGAMLGTPRYMSPEQVTGQKVDGRSDIYSVGILLYEVLTGSPPFMTGDISYQQVNKLPVEPRLINHVIPQSVNNFIMKCLEKKAENRFADAGQSRDALAEILRGLGGSKKFENQGAQGNQTPLREKKTAVQEVKQARLGATTNASQGTVKDIERMELDDLDLDFPAKR